MGIEKFADVLIEEQRTVGRKCDLARMFERMPDDLLVEVKAALADPSWTAAAISRTLTRFQFPVTEGAVRRCRRICDCWRVDAVA